MKPSSLTVSGLPVSSCAVTSTPGTSLVGASVFRRGEFSPWWFTAVPLCRRLERFIDHNTRVDSLVPGDVQQIGGFNVSFLTSPRIGRVVGHNAPTPGPRNLDSSRPQQRASSISRRVLPSLFERSTPAASPQTPVSRRGGWVSQPNSPAVLIPEHRRLQGANALAMDNFVATFNHVNVTSGLGVGKLGKFQVRILSHSLKKTSHLFLSE